MRVMGIDLGIKKIAWAIWEDGVLTATGAYESPSQYRPMQLHDLQKHIIEIARLHKVDHVFIEDTLIGNNRKYSINLSQTMGAVQASLFRCSVFTVNVSTWKSEVIGNGRADKQAVQNYIYSRDSAYAELCGNDQDRFDAACIGYYGVLIDQRARKLEAARSTSE